MHTIREVPGSLRLTGCWIIWSVWCSGSGWALSAVSRLDGWGHLALLPILIIATGLWLRATAAIQPRFGRAQKIRQRMLHPLPLIYLAVMGLSLLAALLNDHPWSFDATTYRLPRTLYWWSAQHWYWIGALDHRLDFSSLGFEWQMLPVLELTHSDRFIFLLNWLPMWLMPGLVFLTFRALGVGGRSARRWMWLLPTGFCYALQCSGLQNDGYAVNYLLAAMAFAAYAFHSGRVGGVWLAVLAAALLTGAKLSNLPLVLPLGIMLWPALGRVKWAAWPVVPVAILAFYCSFLPLAIQSWRHTGDWAGDPGDQWNMRPANPVGGMLANLVELADDATQPPFFPGVMRVNAWLEPLNQSAAMRWLERSHSTFTGVHYGQMPYEGNCGLGCGVWLYAVFLAAGCWFVKAVRQPLAGFASGPRSWRLVPWLGLISFLVLYAKLGSAHTERNAATFYPLLFVLLLQSPRVAILERRWFSAAVASVGALLVVPVILLTPARPVIPVEHLAQWFPRPALKSAAAKYHVWTTLRDDLAPLRAQLPPDATRLGYAGGIGDTAYGLCRPIGSRAIVELGLPIGSGNLPPPDLKYGVVTERGLQERYQLDLKTWLKRVRGEIVATHHRSTGLETRSAPTYESWYLVKLNPSVNHPGKP